MWSVVTCCQKAWHTSTVFGDEWRMAGCPCASSLYRCCLRERLTGWLLWQLDSCSYRRSHRSMPRKWGREGGEVCLFYPYEVPRTCKAVSFTNGAWAWMRKNSTEQFTEREHRWVNIRHHWRSLKNSNNETIFFSVNCLSKYTNRWASQKSKHLIWSTRSVWAATTFYHKQVKILCSTNRGDDFLLQFGIWSKAY